MRGMRQFATVVIPDSAIAASGYGCWMHGRAYQFWQEGVHPEWIQNEAMSRRKVEHIHQNPVKRGYVDRTGYWRYSSARNYAGPEGLLEVSALW